MNSQNVRLYNIRESTISNGEGIRMAFFFQGCKHGCAGCHNEHTWDAKGGHAISIKDLERKIDSTLGDKLYDGITFTGGEPFEQAEQAAHLASYSKAKNINVWVYSGYTYEQLWAIADQEEGIWHKKLLENTDVLVDGPFIENLRTRAPFKGSSSQFKGSSNQRVIELKDGRMIKCLE